MRQGRSPQEACEEAINRILKKHEGKPDFQVAYLATNKKGNIGAYSVMNGFSYTHNKNKINQNTNSNSVY
jgi:N4-(beta-N-acetylglucosaminyl)-L-asparaginase